MMFTHRQYKIVLCLLVILNVPVFLHPGLFSLTLLSQENLSLEAYRTVDVVTSVQVINPVRIRTEPTIVNGATTVIITAQPGTEFPIRQEVAWVQADNFTWLPIVVEGEDAWVAREGFVNLIEEKVDIRITQDEIEFALTADAPEGADDIIARDNTLHAVDARGNLVGIWDWGRETIEQARWLHPAPAQLGGFAGKFLTVEYDGDQATIVLWNGEGERVDEIWTSPPDLTVRYARAEWSPRGDMISVEYWKNGGYVSLLQPDGTEITTIRTRITFFGGPNGQANWSPDGSWLVFSSMGELHYVDVYRVDADGKNLVQLTNSFVEEDSPIVTPDGNHILYRVDNGHIYIMNTDGTEIRLFVSGPAAMLD